MRELARRLLAASRDAAVAGAAEGPRMHEAVVVCETLRISLTKLAGADGFTSLMRRALALARTEAPVLQSVKFESNCHLEGLEVVVTGEGGAEAAVALAAHLLTLLVTFIGEPLTLRVVREAWPHANLDASQ